MRIVCMFVMHVLSLGNSFYGILCALKVDSQVDWFFFKLNFLWLNCNKLQYKHQFVYSYRSLSLSICLGELKRLNFMMGTS